MSLLWAIFVFLNVWWLMLFCVLPLGVENHAEHSGIEYAAAPRRPNWKKKLLLNTVLAFAVTAVVYIAANLGLLPVRQWLDVYH